MGLFEADLKVVVCSQQSLDPGEKKCSFCEVGIKPGRKAAQMQWLEGVHNQMTGQSTSSPQSGWEKL